MHTLKALTLLTLGFISCTLNASGEGSLSPILGQDSIKESALLAIKAWDADAFQEAHCKFPQDKCQIWNADLIKEVAKERGELKVKMHEKWTMAADYFAQRKAQDLDKMLMLCDAPQSPKLQRRMKRLSLS